jgi:4-hydroxy-2-oxoheptanedioate aldolase
MTQPHKARHALRNAYEGKIDPLICYYCGVGSVPTARIMAQMGADMVWVDWEHASMGVETMTSVGSNLLPDVAGWKLTD